MKLIGIGLFLMVVAVLMFLDQVNVLALGDWFEYLWIALVFLVGLEMILSAQRKATEKKVTKVQEKEKKKIKKEMTHSHVQSQKELKDEIHKKEEVINEQEEVIDDLINPKK